MEARAIARHVRISPRKARIVADLVRGMSLEHALEVLKYSKKAAARPIEKTVISAMHNLAERYEHPVEPGDMEREGEEGEENRHREHDGDDGARASVEWQSPSLLGKWGAPMREFYGLVFWDGATLHLQEALP